MKKGIKVLIIVLIILILYLVIKWSSFYAGVSLNLRPVDKSCNTDSDCVMAQIDCSPCSYGSKGGAVNKNYKPLCPLKIRNYPCPDALPEWYGYAAVCKNKKCVKGESLYNR